MHRSFRSACVVLACVVAGSALAGRADAQDTLSNATPARALPAPDSSAAPAVTAIDVGVRPAAVTLRADAFIIDVSGDGLASAPGAAPIHFPQGKGYPMLIGGITAALLGVYVIPGNAGGAIAVTGAIVGLYGLYAHFR